MKIYNNLKKVARLAVYSISAKPFFFYVCYKNRNI